MIKKKIENGALLEHLNTLPPDGRQVFLLENGQVRLTALSATTLVNQMRANHNLGVVESYVLGQAYMASLLMASSVKGNDRIQVTFECAGPIGAIHTEAWACGAVRGYLKNNPMEIKEKLEGRNISSLFGPGFLSVSKILEGNKTPFTGQIMLEYGDIAKDIALYYTQSEQTPTMFSLGIHFNPEGQILGAGGLFIQAMPGCETQVLDRLQKKSTLLKPIGKALADKCLVFDYCMEEFKEFNPVFLSKEQAGFSCPCCRENFAAFLHNLPQKEKNEILKMNKDTLELECFNCSSIYSFTKEEIQEIFK